MSLSAWQILNPYQDSLATGPLITASFYIPPEQKAYIWIAFPQNSRSEVCANVIDSNLLIT